MILQSYLGNQIQNFPIKLRILAESSILRRQTHNNSIYHLQSLDCAHKYIRQTCRQFKIWYQQHFKNNNNNSTISQHILDNGHAIAPMEDTTDFLYATNREGIWILSKNKLKMVPKSMTIIVTRKQNLQHTSTIWK